MAISLLFIKLSESSKLDSHGRTFDYCGRSSAIRKSHVVIPTIALIAVQYLHLPLETVPESRRCFRDWMPEAWVLEVEQMVLAMIQRAK